MLLRWLVMTIAILISSYLLSGVSVDGPVAAIVTALVLGLINAFLKPLAILLTLPITVLTFGLFIFVINALLIMLTSAIVPGFTVEGFLWAVVFSLILSFLVFILESAFKEVGTKQ